MKKTRTVDGLGAMTILGALCDRVVTQACGVEEYVTAMGLDQSQLDQSQLEQSQLDQSQYLQSQVDESDRLEEPPRSEGPGPFLKSIRGQISFAEPDEIVAKGRACGLVTNTNDIDSTKLDLDDGWEGYVKLVRALAFSQKDSNNQLVEGLARVSQYDWNGSNWDCMCLASDIGIYRDHTLFGQFSIPQSTPEARADFIKSVCQCLIKCELNEMLEHNTRSPEIFAKKLESHRKPLVWNGEIEEPKRIAGSINDRALPGQTLDEQMRKRLFAERRPEAFISAQEEGEEDDESQWREYIRPQAEGEEEDESQLRRWSSEPNLHSKKTALEQSQAHSAKKGVLSKLKERFTGKPHVKPSDVVINRDFTRYVLPGVSSLGNAGTPPWIPRSGKDFVGPSEEEIKEIRWLGEGGGVKNTQHVKPSDRVSTPGSAGGLLRRTASTSGPRASGRRKTQTHGDKYPIPGLATDGPFVRTGSTRSETAPPGVPNPRASTRSLDGYQPPRPLPRSSRGGRPLHPLPLKRQDSISSMHSERGTTTESGTGGLPRSSSEPDLHSKKKGGLWNKAKRLFNRGGKHDKKPSNTNGERPRIKASDIGPVGGFKHVGHVGYDDSHMMGAANDTHVQSMTPGAG